MEEKLKNKGGRVKRKIVKYKSGIYETIYGNACEYNQGTQAWDLDAREIISVEMINFDRFIRDFD